MHFSSFGSTINSRLIVSAITLHGIPVFHASKAHLKPFLCRNSACNLADIIAVYKQSERFYVVGIEINELYLYPDMDFRSNLMERITSGC